MHIPGFFKQMRTLVAMAVIGVVGGVGAGLGFAALQADDDGEERGALTIPGECTGFGQASFVGPESMDHLMSAADVVAKVRITARASGRVSEVSGTGGRHIVYTLDILDVLVGEEKGQSVTLGLSFGEVCLDPGDDEFYMFMRRVTEDQRVPAEYGSTIFGWKNFWVVNRGMIHAREHWPPGPALERYDGISEEEFRRAVLESAERKAAQSEE